MLFSREHHGTSQTVLFLKLIDIQLYQGNITNDKLQWQKRKHFNPAGIYLFRNKAMDRPEQCVVSVESWA